MPVRHDLGRRLIITGSSGSGKTVLGHRLGVLLQVQHTDLDLIVIDNKGQRKPFGKTSEELETLALSEEWVLEGSPWDVPERAWSTASTVVFLDLPRVHRAWRQFRREFPRRLLETRAEVHGWKWRRLWGDIRHTLTASRTEGERRRKYVREKASATVPLIEISSVKGLHNFIRDVGST